MRDFNHYWYESHDGLKLYARDYPCRHSRGHSEKTIVCIPGLTRNSADFSLLAQHLSTRFRVVSVDLRGRGKSDYDPNPSNYQPGVYARDMCSALDALELTDVVLIGTSLGGLVSILLTSMQPKRISAVILNDIGPQPNQAGLDRIKSYVSTRNPVNSWDQAVEQTRATLNTAYPYFTDADWRQITENFYQEDESGKPVLAYDPAISIPLGQEEADKTADSDLWPLFGAMRCIPTLLIHGELSDILTQDDVAKMLEVHPAMEYTRVGCCGHAPLLTEQACRLAIDQFLAQHEVQR